MELLPTICRTVVVEQTQRKDDIQGIYALYILISVHQTFQITSKSTSTLFFFHKKDFSTTNIQ